MVAPLSSQRLQLDCAEWPIRVGVSAETFREAAQFLWGDVSRLDDVERVSGPPRCSVSYRGPGFAAAGLCQFDDSLPRRRSIEDSSRNLSITKWAGEHYVQATEARCDLDFRCIAWTDRRNLTLSSAGYDISARKSLLIKYCVMSDDRKAWKVVVLSEKYNVLSSPELHCR